MNTLDKSNEVKLINSVFDDIRKKVSQDLINYIIENDGVVEAWPNPQSD